MPQPNVSKSQPSHRLSHIRELDGVRGIAALMVFFHHVCFVSTPETIWPAPLMLLRNLSVNGRYGVDLFFVLSGFLITSILIGTRNDKSYYHDFYWKRALRILPLYIVCLAALVLAAPRFWGYVVMSLLFLSNFAGLVHTAASGPFWTLAIEEQFYLVWPTVVRLRSVGQLRRWAISIGLSSVVLRLIAAIFGHCNYYFTFFHCDGLAFGAFLACWYVERNAQSQNPRRENFLIAFAFALAILLLMLPMPDSDRGYSFRQAFLQTAVTLICGSAIAVTISHSDRRGLAFLRSRILTFFGLISYAFYLIHAYVMNVYDSRHPRLVSGDLRAYGIRFITIFLVTLALCLLSRYLIELPAMSLRRFVLAKPAQPQPGEPPLPLGNM